MIEESPHFSRKEELGIDWNHIPGNYFFSIGVTDEGWHVIHVSVPHHNIEKRGGSGNLFTCTVPAELGQRIYAETTQHPEFPLEWFKAIYPDFITVDPTPNRETLNTKITLPPMKKLWLLNRAHDKGSTTFYTNTPNGSATSWETIPL
jgi:hypothetical protein